MDSRLCRMCCGNQGGVLIAYCPPLSPFPSCRSESPAHLFSVHTVQITREGDLDIGCQDYSRLLQHIYVTVHTQTYKCVHASSSCRREILFSDAGQ